MRIEGLWGPSPPTPVWPDSAQTALLFVGVPVLTALVLMAAPLHDAAPPPAQEVAPAALVADEGVPKAPSIEARPGVVASRRAVSRPQRNESEPLPAVIYETRRTIHRSYARAAVGGSAAVTPASSTSVWRESMPAPVTMAPVLTRPEPRATPASLESQSP